MNFKSTLCAATLLAAANVAQAFPDYSIMPEDGKTLTSAGELMCININLVGANSVDCKDLKAVLETEEGDEVFNTNSMYMMGTIIVQFDTNEITSNGTWYFTIDEGSFTVDGEANPQINAIYTLNDPNLNMGDYPQIDLVSIDPEDGSKLALWGGTDLPKVKMKTSDDAAVNYIEWSLWDISDGTDVYMTSGNDNRYDFNRYEHNDDIWADGLYILLPELDDLATKLVLDHTYRLDLRFCGIGYDPEANQYPNPQQIEKSTELVTSVTYQGLTPPPVYAKAEYVSVSPDPDNYEIDDPNLAFFDVTYSAPAKPVAFTYAFGMGAGTFEAGTFEPFEGMEVDENGLCTRWTFTFFPEVIADKTGSIVTNIQSVDAEGLYVRGNADMLFDNIDYTIVWNCNCGAPELLSVSPLNGATVECLSSVTISNDKNGVSLPMNISFNTTETMRIVTRQGEEIRVLAKDEDGFYPDLKFSGDLLSVTWDFEPITESGNYVLIIPKDFFALGEEFDGASSNLATFEYIVSDGSSSLKTDLMPVKITPDDKTSVEQIAEVYLEFDQPTFMVNVEDGSGFREPKRSNLYRLTNDGKELVQSLEAIDDMDNPNYSFWTPMYYVFNFSTVTEKGQYVIEIDEATFCNQEADESFYEEGSVNPAFNIYYAIGEEVGVESIVGEGSLINVYDLNGVQVLRDADVDAAKALKSGIYIINGKKVIIRR